MCPTCQGTQWEQNRAPVGAWGCQSCGSHVCPADATKQVTAHIGIDAATLGALARDQSQPSALSCPVCQQRMRRFLLKGVQTHACLTDGLTCFAAGDLERLVPELSPMLVTGGGSGLELDAPTPVARPAGAAGPAPDRPGAHVEVHGGAADPFDDGTPLAPAGAGGAMGFLGQAGRIELRQRRKAGELLGIEQKNDYEIDAGVAGIGHALEEGGGVLGVALRQVLGARRPLSISLQDPQGQPQARAERKFTFWMPQTTVHESATGRPMGAVRKKFALLSRQYDLVDGKGQLFAQVKAGFFRVWKFPLVQPGTTTEVGAITKQHAGLLQEAFTDADNFSIEFADPDRFDVDQRAVLVACALGIDMDYFEKSSRSNTPIKALLSIVAFVGFFFLSMCGEMCGGSDAPSAKEILDNAAHCYQDAAGVADCEVCCLEGSVFEEDKCHCLGVEVKCPDGDIDPAAIQGKLDPEEDCRTCCAEALGTELLSDVWVEASGACHCSGGYDPEIFGG